MKGAYNTKDIVSGKIRMDSIQDHYVILHDMSKMLDTMGDAMNMMAKLGWRVKSTWSGYGSYALMEKE